MRGRVDRQRNAEPARHMVKHHGNQHNEFLRYELVVEEKVDGANLGISFDENGTIRVQNRGEYFFTS